MKRQNNRIWITVFTGIAMIINSLGGCGRISTDAVISDTAIEIVSDMADETELVSETADMAGQVAAETTLTRYAVCDNGWSQVSYNGSAGFVKTEYLTQ